MTNDTNDNFTPNDTNDTGETMTTATLTAAQIARRAERAERAAYLETLERDGLQLITADDLKELQLWVRIRTEKRDGAEIESRAISILAILFAKYGKDERDRCIRSAAKKAANRVASSAQVGRRREARPTAADRYTMAGERTVTVTFDAIGAKRRADAPTNTRPLTAVQRDAVTAAAVSSNLAPIARGYAHNARTLRTSAEGAEGIAWSTRRSEGMRVALELVFGPEVVEAMHLAYVAEERTMRRGKNAVGSIKRNRSIRWAMVADTLATVDGLSANRGAVMQRAQVMARRAELIAMRADMNGHKSIDHGLSTAALAWHAEATQITETLTAALSA